MKLRERTDLSSGKDFLIKAYREITEHENTLKDNGNRPELFLGFWRTYFINLAPLLKQKNSTDKIDIINQVFANAVQKFGDAWLGHESWINFVCPAMIKYLDAHVTFLKNGGVHKFEK